MTFIGDIADPEKQYDLSQQLFGLADVLKQTPIAEKLRAELTHLRTQISSIRSMAGGHPHGQSHILRSAGSRRTS